MVGYSGRGARKGKGRRAAFSGDQVDGLILCFCLKTEREPRQL